MAVEHYIKEQGITQQQAAKLMGVTQPKISNIVNGNIDKITIDMLVNMLAKVDIKINMTVGDQSKQQNEGIYEERDDFTEGTAHYLIYYQPTTIDTIEGFPRFEAFDDEHIQPQIYTTDTTSVAH